MCEGGFTAENPVPYPAAGCDEGPEGMSKHTEEIKVPFTGTLPVSMEGFYGDWDLFIKDGDESLLNSATSSQLQGDPAAEQVTVLVKKGMTVLIIPCNWLGGPTAEVTWEIAR